MVGYAEHWDVTFLWNLQLRLGSCNSFYPVAQHRSFLTHVAYPGLLAFTPLGLGEMGFMFITIYWSFAFSAFFARVLDLNIARCFTLLFHHFLLVVWCATSLREQNRLHS